MGEEPSNTIDFGCCFDYEAVQERLDIEFGYRLPTIQEAIMIDFPYEQIWLSDIIGNRNTVMDREWGVQCVTDGDYALILVEK